MMERKDTTSLDFKREKLDFIINKTPFSVCFKKKSNKVFAKIKKTFELLTFGLDSIMFYTEYSTNFY